MWSENCKNVRARPAGKHGWQNGSVCDMIITIVLKWSKTKENDRMFDNGTFAIAGADGRPVRCEVLMTYDCEDNGRSYVVYTVGEGTEKQLAANRYTVDETGETTLLPLENEAEYALVRHCFEQLKAQLLEQAQNQATEA